MQRIALLCTALALPLPGLGAELGINLYGLSYHLDRSRAREMRVDNEFNPGLGVRLRIPHSERMAWILDAGVYRDSGRNTALLAGGGRSLRCLGGMAARRRRGAAR